MNEKNDEKLELAEMIKCLRKQLVSATSEGQGEEKLGSGYTIGTQWVITAYHVLVNSKIDTNKPLQSAI